MILPDKVLSIILLLRKAVYRRRFWCLNLLLLLRFEECFVLCARCIVSSACSLSVSQVLVLIAVAHLEGYSGYVSGTTTNEHDGSSRGGLAGYLLSFCGKTVVGLGLRLKDRCVEKLDCCIGGRGNGCHAGEWK